MSDLTIRARTVLLDIEGTISPQAFVHGVLFPYARERLADFVTLHEDEPAVARLLEETRRLADGADPVETLVQWIDRDEKAPPLKALQGMIWRAGFESGAFVAPLYPDAFEAVQRWHAAGLELAIYSSGSVEAQRLFFAHTEHGDLSRLFVGHYDTGIGSKLEAASYTRIAEDLGRAPGDIVFFSDNAKELVAAVAAGLHVVHVVKDATPPDARFPSLTEFDGNTLVCG